MLNYIKSVCVEIRHDIEAINAESIRWITELSKNSKIDDKLLLSFLTLTKPFRKTLRYWDDLCLEYKEHLIKRKGKLKKLWLKLLKQIS